MKLLIVREPQPSHTYGKMYVDGVYAFETLEDIDRKLEDGGEKIYGETCIPRGTYRIKIDWSNHFGKEMIHVLDVPKFEGIRIHGGKTTQDSLGCPLVGTGRAVIGGSPALLNGRYASQSLFNRVNAALELKEEVWLEVQ